MTAEKYIGFPAPLLGLDSQRLPVLFDDGELIAISKPVGVGVIQDNWYPKTPLLIDAIRYQAEQGKPELERLGVGREGLFATHDLDSDIAGPVLFGRRQEMAESLRNDIGAQFLVFEFHLLCTEAPCGKEQLCCDLPIARHFNQKKMVVSNTTGKKCETTFSLLDQIGKFSLWSAKTNFLRRHQICIHAKEVGLKIVGDSIYSRVHPVYLSAVKRGYRPKRNADERPLYEGPSLFLQSIVLPNGERVLQEAPSRFATQLKYLKRFAKSQR